MSAAQSSTLAGSMQGAESGVVSLLVNGKQLTGWQAIRVTRSIDRVPSDFDIALTERYPARASQMSAEPGQSCQVMIGSDLVVTGYIDRVLMSVGPSSHTLRIMGRSKCEDIVDCSITPDILNGNGINTASLLDLATRICKPYGIRVKNLAKTSLALPTGAGNQFGAILTETGWLVLDRVARYLGVLLYDDTDGNLVIADVGTATMASGFQEGVNVQHADVSFSMDERFSEYLPCLMSANTLGTQGVGGVSYAKAYDAGVPRFRQLIIVSEQFQVGQLAERRAQWEVARRAGRSQAMHVLCDSWRDSSGKLWQPNAFAPISLPSLKLTTSANQWVIGSVSFMRDINRGTIADLVMMPKAAFQPEPTLLLPPLPSPDTPAAPPT